MDSLKIARATHTCGFLTSRTLTGLVIAIAGIGSCLGQDVNLAVSSGSAVPGSVVNLNITLSASAAQPAALEWTLTYPTVDFSSVAIAAGPMATGANKSVTCANSAGTVQCIVSGLNDAVIPDGIVATMALTVSTSPQDTSSQVQLTSETAAGTGATTLPIASSDGVVTIISAPALNGFSCTPIALSPASGSTCTVALTAAAGSGAIVNLASSPAGVNIPAGVTVPQGATATTFPVTAGSVSAPTTVTLTASYSGASETFALTVNPPPATLGGVSVSPTTIISGQSGTGTINLTGVAGGGGAVVTLSGSNSSAASVPASITVAQGASSATFPVTTGSVSVATAVTLTATYAGVSKTVGLTVNPIPAALSGVSISSGTIVSGQSGTGTVALTGAVSSGGALVTLSSSNSSAASVPASVNVAQGASSATFPVTTGSVNTATSVTLTATYAGVSKTVGLTVNPLPAQLSGISVNPLTILGGQSGTGTISFTGAAGAGGAVVSLASSNPAVVVPASVTVPQNSTSVSFSVTTSSVQVVTSVVLLASYAGVSKPVTLTINPPPAALSGILVTPSTIGSGQSATATISLTGAAGAGGAVVALSSSNSAAASVPASVTVPQNATSTAFAFTGGNVSSPSSVVITASYSGLSATANVTVNPAAGALSSIVVSPSTVSSGQSASGTVTLTTPAGAGGVSVSIASSNTAALVPSTVTIAKGSTSATFNVTTGNVGSSTSAVITGSYLSLKVTAGLTINPPPAALASISVAPASIIGGQAAAGTVNLTSAAGVGGVAISLSSSNAAAGVPVTITVPQGALTANFSVPTQTVTIATPVTLGAFYNGTAKTASLTVNPPATALSSITVNPNSIVGGLSTSGTVTLTAPAGANGVIVSLASSNPTAASVPATVTIPAGATFANFPVSAGMLSATTTVVLSCSFAGVSMSANLTITAPVSQPPTAPGSLTAANASPGQVNLGWTASIDSLGVTAYFVERCQAAGCTNFGQIATSTGTAYSDTGLTAGATYLYRVRATDAAGYLSLYSNVASVTTPSAAPTAISYVQGNYATPQSRQATVSVRFTAAQTAGDLNVVVVGWNDTKAVVAAVSDSNGNTYTLAVGPAAVKGSLSQSIYYAKNISASSTGSNLVTVNFSGAAAYPDVRIVEYSGIDPNNPLDGSAAGNGNSKTSKSGSVTTANAGDLLFAANIVGTYTTGAGAGFITRMITSPDGDIVEDQIAMGTGTYSATAPLNRNGPWVMQLVAFRAASQ